MSSSTTSDCGRALGPDGGPAGARRRSARPDHERRVPARRGADARATAGACQGARAGRAACEEDARTTVLSVMGSGHLTTSASARGRLVPSRREARRGCRLEPEPPEPQGERARLAAGAGHGRSPGQ